MRHLSVVSAAFALLASSLPAAAHPHIFIDARATIAFNDAGEVIGVHNDWTFDEAYSSWAIQGLDTDNDGKVTRAEMQDLANDNMVGLNDYEYYTFAGEGPQNLKFVHGSNATLDYVGGRTTLSFDVALDRPYAIASALELAINDPEYYVAITFADATSVTLVNAPKNCTATLEAGHTMPDEIADELYALPADVTTLPPALAEALRGVQGAILITCPGGSATGTPATPAAEIAPTAPATALNAATQLAEAAPPLDAASTSHGVPALFGPNAVPFGGPPPEPGLHMPRDGVLGWVAQQQRDFYQALTGALGRLKSDWTAFWLLGGLSFLYGIFHAAGPGHGKVVISSYVLANEQQARRGIWLSFLSAMMQSAVAVAFVAVAAWALNMTSLAMSDAASWIGILSYGLVALLGLWLVARKLFGWGHSHTHAPTNDRVATARRHLHVDADKSSLPAQVQQAHALANAAPALTSLRPAVPDAYGRPPGHAHYGHDHTDHHDDDHRHADVITPGQLGGDWREQAGVVLAVGLRPCSGALVVLVFALSQDVLAAGIAAVFLMGLGTASTTGTLATIAVGTKGLARRLSGVDNPVTVTLVWWAELLGAFAVFAFGILLVLASL